MQDFLTAISILEKVKKSFENRLASDAYQDVLYSSSAFVPAQIAGVTKCIRALSEVFEEEDRKYAKSIEPFEVIDEGAL